MKAKTYEVTFYNMAGESLGSLEVCASSPSKAKVAASLLCCCSWVSQTVVSLPTGNRKPTP